MAVAYSPGETLLPRNDAPGPCAYAMLGAAAPAAALLDAEYLQDSRH